MEQPISNSEPTVKCIATAQAATTANDDTNLLEQVLFSMAWKNGDLGTVREIIAAILSGSGEPVHNQPSC
jgi:hypothetical protein